MFHIYDENYRITDVPVSADMLFNILKPNKMEQHVVSTLQVGKHLTLDTFKVVRVS